MPIKPNDFQAFVTLEFLRDTVIPDQTAYLETRGRFEYAQWIESLVWLMMGAEIGYFDPARTLIATREFGRAPECVVPLTWPKWFDVRQDIEFFSSVRTLKGWPFHSYGMMIIYEQLEPNQATTLAIFQTALILAREFRKGCCVGLQKVLQDQDLLYATFRDVQGAQILSFLSGSVPVEPENSDCQLAGFMQLINLLASFEAVFPPRKEKSISEGPRQTIAKMIGNLLAWRLNLRNKSVVQNLSIIESAFWNLCENELSEQVTFWSSSISQDNLQQLFNNWRDRSGPDELLPFGNLPSVAPGNPSSWQRFQQT